MVDIGFGAAGGMRDYTDGNPCASAWGVIEAGLIGGTVNAPIPAEKLIGLLINGGG
jgi:hypothetical protein